MLVALLSKSVSSLSNVTYDSVSPLRLVIASLLELKLTLVPNLSFFSPLGASNI